MDSGGWNRTDPSRVNDNYRPLLPACWQRWNPVLVGGRLAWPQPNLTRVQRGQTLTGPAKPSRFGCISRSSCQAAGSPAQNVATPRRPANPAHRASCRIGQACLPAIPRAVLKSTLGERGSAPFFAVIAPIATFGRALSARAETHGGVANTYLTHSIVHNRLPDIYRRNPRSARTRSQRDTASPAIATPS